MHGWPGLFAKPGLPGSDSIPGTREDHPLPSRERERIIRSLDGRE